jgi:SAM-dependent methyltransferase
MVVVSRAVLDEHRSVWQRKPALADVYGVWFEALAAQVPRDGIAVEIGAGPGFLGSYVRDRRPDLHWLSTDVLPAPWNDLAADGLRLPLRAASADAVVGLDTLHHLARPHRFFQEAVRVLKPGGRIAVVEPWVTPFSYPIYRFLHREGCRLSLDPWNPFALSGSDDKAAFDGDAAVAFRLLRATTAAEWEQRGLRPPEVRPLNGLAYLLSLGFQPASLLPKALAPAFLFADRALAFGAPLLAMRVLAVWVKPGPHGA